MICTQDLSSPQAVIQRRERMERATALRAIRDGAVSGSFGRALDDQDFRDQRALSTIGEQS